MTGIAILPHRCVLPQVRPTLLRVTGVASLVDTGRAHHLRANRPMRLVTSRAGHPAFAVLVAEQVRRTLKLRLPHITMTLEAGLRLCPRLQHFGFRLRVGKQLTGVNGRRRMMRTVTAQAREPGALVLAAAP